MIIFPMAGLSSRFSNAGYKVPKFKLPLWNGSVFDYAASSFADAFSLESFLFIYRETGNVRNFIEGRCRALGIKDARFVELGSPTSGQAETVELGLDATHFPTNEAITIFNIDTFRLPGVPSTKLRPGTDGMLEVFRGSGENWSFVRPDPINPTIAIETAEKVAISDLCSNGLYSFASQNLFREALAAERKLPSAKELYIAPLYNHLISRGLKISCNLVPSEKIKFCGVPAEYEDLVKAPPPYHLETGLENQCTPTGNE